ncbi:MAG: transcriptional regulator PpsR [Caulobacteraceae bacterium]|nr:transcriptional regulator PpsR [Caulobacter sp.]
MPRPATPALPDEVSRESFVDALKASADLALLLDPAGEVLGAWSSDPVVARADPTRWVGRRWVDTVTVESRGKVEQMLAAAEAGAGATQRPRHVNHPGAGGDLPLAYSIAPLEAEGLLVAIGRDLSQTAALQQQLVRAQQQLEADYDRMRQAQTRYRMLARISSDGMVTLDAETRRITELNPAAADMLGFVAARAAGKRLLDAFEPDSARALAAQLDAVAEGEVEEITVTTAGDGREHRASAVQVREDGADLVLLRLAAAPGAPAADPDAERRALALATLRDLPDGFAVVERDGRILAANAAMLALLQLPSEGAARRTSLADHLGRFDVDLDVLSGALREGGSVRLFATTLRGEQGGVAEVEISAVAVQEGARPAFGLLVRDVGRRLSAPERTSAEPLATADELADMVGRLPLKDIVGRIDEEIERRCIRTALRMTGGGRAAAADLLGLSRQSLYLKLRRYGMAEEGEDDA